MKAENAKLQCANVQRIGNAHSHITPNSKDTRRTMPAQPSLKSLAGAVLGRTFPRTNAAHSAQSTREFGVQCSANLHFSKLAELVRKCGAAYDFTEQEHAEALAAAMADPVDALRCFRTMLEYMQWPTAA